MSATNPLCKYKYALGIPGQGVHSYRFMNVAIVDVGMTIVAAFLISYFFKFSFWIVLLSLFVLGIILHKMFCVKTTIDQLIFGE